MSVEQRLRDVLSDAAPAGNLGVTFDDIERQVRSRRRSAVTTSAIVVLLITAIAITALQLGHTAGQHGPIKPPPGPTANRRPPAPGGVVSYHGISFALPRTWTTARPTCGLPPTHSVVVSQESASNLYCPFERTHGTPPTYVELSALYGPQFALSWSGRRGTWHGQPIWRSTTTHHRITSVVVSLPWLDATVTAASPRPAIARQLLQRVGIHPLPGLAVPASARAVFIQTLDARAGYGERSSARVSDPAEVNAMLSDLRSLQPLAAGQPACGGGWYRSTALITVPEPGGARRTYAARFDNCGEVIGGTGNALLASPQLLSDIRRLVPNSGL